MKFNRFLAFIMAGVLAASVCACGVDSGDNSDTTDTASDTSTDTTADTEAYNYSAGLDENGFFEGIKASEIVTLPEYKGVEIPESVTVASEEDLQREIDTILESYSEDIYEEITDKAIANGDTVNIDYVGSIDNVEFQGGNTGGLGTDVTIGVTNYIDGFLEQLIGHKPGENFDIQVTFPENYGRDELNGKDAIFNITINYIKGELIETVTPEFSDEIAADYGFDSAEAFISYIEAQIIQTQKYNYVNGILSEATCAEVPQEIFDILINADIAQAESYAEMYGMAVEDYMKLCGYDSVDVYIESRMESYESNALNCLTVQAVAEIEGLVVSDEDITANGYDIYVESLGKPYIKQFLLSYIVVPEFIINNAKIVK